MTNAFLWMAFVAFGSPVAGPTAADLVGTWRYVGEVDRHADGTVADLVPRAGYEGLLVYTANWYVTAQIYPKGRTWKPGSVTREELQTTFDLSASYFGTYTVNAAAGEITHHVLANLDPTGSGWDDEKHFTLSGDTLVLKGIWEVRGEEIRYEVTWQRVR
ncbi:MAG TPA: lipocalin-like domain-containing protein [Thermoanaerobaculia bacterium]|nr:lipocalin-like domain-containing protein [Thermoanaerobaculia bacterium]